MKNEDLSELYLLKEIVEKVWGIPDISVNTRKREIHAGRVGYIELALSHTKNYYSYRQVGVPIKRDHSTVVYNKSNCHDVYLRFDPDYRKKFQQARMEFDVEYRLNQIKSLERELTILKETM